CRSEDMAFRYGGEEFCVVCTDTDLATARIVAERIRGAVELESYASGEREIAVTVSVGVAAIAPAQANAEALLKDADAALYRAKQAGRNRVEASPAAGQAPTAAGT
ncbi:MAG: GGDEF domain-containing protein, partial [Rhodocyclales bacterium]|nr:GGDEF domain-containing protein [Rhodocyclales bacterium]